MVQDEAPDPGHLALHIVLTGMGHVVLEAREDLSQKRQDFDDALMHCRDCFALFGEMRKPTPSLKKQECRFIRASRQNISISYDRFGTLAEHLPKVVRSID